MDSYATRGKGLKSKYSSVVSSIATNVGTRPKVTVTKHSSAKIQITSRTPQMFVKQTTSYISVPSIYIDEVTHSEENMTSTIKPSTSNSSETKKTLTSADMVNLASTENNTNGAMSVYRTVNCGSQKSQMTHKPTDDLRNKFQQVGSKLSNLQKRCNAPAKAYSSTPPSNNSRESDMSSLYFGISETSACVDQMKSYDPRRYEDNDNSDQSRKIRVDSVRMEIEQWKNNHKKKTGHRKSQSSMLRRETGARSKSRLVSALEKLEVEYKQLQKEALERDRDGSWESINISRPVSSKVSYGVQSGDSSGVSIATRRNENIRMIEKTSASRYPLDDYITRMQPSPPRENGNRTTLADIAAYEQTQRLLHNAKRTMFNLQSEVSMEISKTDIGDNGDLTKWNIKQLINEKLQEIRPLPQKQIVYAMATSTVDHHNPPQEPIPQCLVTERTSSELHQDFLKTNEYMDHAFALAQNVNHALNNQAVKASSSGKDKKKKKKKKETKTGGSSSSSKGSGLCNVHSREAVQLSSTGVDRIGSYDSYQLKNQGYTSIAEQSKECTCCVGCGTHQNQCGPQNQSGPQRNQCGPQQNEYGPQQNEHGRYMTWDTAQKPSLPQVRFVPVKGTTSNATVIEIKALKNPEDLSEKDKSNNLIVQELPKMSIRTECAVQVGPSINLPSTGKTQHDDNMGLIGVFHCSPCKPVGHHVECVQRQETPFLFDVNNAECVNRTNREETICKTNPANCQHSDSALNTNSVESVGQTSSDVLGKGSQGGPATRKVNDLRPTGGNVEANGGVSGAVTMIAAKLEALEGRSLQQSSRMSEILKFLQEDINMRLDQPPPVQAIVEREVSPSTSFTRQEGHAPIGKQKRNSSKKVVGTSIKSLHKKNLNKKSGNVLGNVEKQIPQKMTIASELLKETNVPADPFKYPPVYTNNLNNFREYPNHCMPPMPWNMAPYGVYQPAAAQPQCACQDGARQMSSRGAVLRGAIHLTARNACGCPPDERYPSESDTAVHRPCEWPAPGGPATPSQVRAHSIIRVPPERRRVSISPTFDPTLDQGATTPVRNLSPEGHAHGRVHYKEAGTPVEEGHVRSDDPPVMSASDEPVRWPVDMGLLNDEKCSTATLNLTRENLNHDGLFLQHTNFNPSISTVLGVRHHGGHDSSRFVLLDTSADASAANASKSMESRRRQLSIVTPYDSDHGAALAYLSSAERYERNAGHGYIDSAQVSRLLTNDEQARLVNPRKYFVQTSDEKSSHSPEEQNVSQAFPNQSVSSHTYNYSFLTGDKGRNASTGSKKAGVSQENQDRNNLIEAELRLRQEQQTRGDVDSGATVLSSLVERRGLLCRQLEMMKSDDLEVLRRAAEVAISHRKVASTIPEVSESREREEEQEEGTSAAGGSEPCASENRRSNEKSSQDTYLSLASDPVSQPADSNVSARPISPEKQSSSQQKASESKITKASTSVKLKRCDCSELLAVFSSADENGADPTVSSSSLSDGEVRSFGEVRTRNTNLKHGSNLAETTQKPSDGEDVCNCASEGEADDHCG